MNSTNTTQPSSVDSPHQGGLTTKEAWALGLSLSAFLLMFYRYFLTLAHGDFSRGFEAILNYPNQWPMAIAFALGGSLLYPGLHLLVWSAFKSKRNNNSRCNILIGWAVILLVLMGTVTVIGR